MAPEEIAAQQYALITLQQARAAGLTDDQVYRRCRHGRWSIVRHEVYAVTGAPATWLQAALAAVLAAGPGAVASHATAGRVWRLPFVDGDSLEITTARPFQRRLPGVRAHRTTSFLAVEHTRHLRIPVTSVARTLVDLSGTLAVAQLGKGTDVALRRGLLRLADLKACAAGLRPAPGRKLARIHAVLRKRLAGYDPSESELELRFARALVAGGLQEPVRQHRIRVGGRTFRIDLAYPQCKLAIELDGWDYHRSRTAFDADRARANHLVVAGYDLLRFTSSTSDEEAVATVAALRPELVRETALDAVSRTNARGRWRVA
jgi:very-short-patch-repair endonuclease